MRPYKRIERCIALYLAPRYQRVAEIGVGANFDVACALSREGCQVICTDIQSYTSPRSNMDFFVDDIFCPTESLYYGADLIYSIRPGVEMIHPMVELAQRVDADLIVYHLGNELYARGGEIIECGVPLHRYNTGIRKKKDMR